MPPAGRGGRGGRGGGLGPPAGPALPPPNPFLFSPAGRSVPVMLHVGLGGIAGAADNTSMVAIPADSDVVSKTQFAPWQATPPAPDGVARVVLTSSQMTRMFLWRCSVGGTAADRAVAARMHVFNGRLNADAWSRILSALLDNGLFAEAFNDWDSFEAAMGGLVLANPADLQLNGADWVPGDDLVVPPQAQDRDLHDRMSYLRFLTLATVSFMEDLTHANRPLESYCYLAGAIGPCFSQPFREDEMATLHFVTQQLRDIVCSRATPDGQAAFGLRRSLPALKLPPMLRSVSVSIDDLSTEMLDAIQYLNPAQRVAVEQRRIDILGTRCARESRNALRDGSLAPCLSRADSLARPVTGAPLGRA